MSKLIYGALAAMSLSAVAAYSAQNVPGSDDGINSAIDGPKPGTELLVIGNGDDPWPEATAPKTARKRVRRANTDGVGYSDDAPDVEFDDYLNALPYTKSRLPLRDPPGMLVVDYDSYGGQTETDSAAAPRPGQLIGEIRSDAAAGASQEEPPDDDPDQNVGYSFGGSSVNDAEAPWQAQIYYPNIAEEWRPKLKARVPLWALQHFCGGALVADNWVMTAAHCIDDGMRRNGYRIRLGQEDVSQPGGWSYRIEKVVVHPQYLARDKAGDINDIALIKISNDMGHARPNWRQVRPIDLYRDPPPPANRPMSVFGWGRTNASTSWNSHAFLMRVGLNVMPHSECTPFAKQLRWSLDQTIICAKAPTGTKRKTCKGDSGGPVVSSGKLLAVVSGGGDRCTGDGIPSMYTRVGAYLSWIDRTTGRAAR